MTNSEQDAYQAGRDARAGGKEPAMPSGYRATKSLAKAWKKGWEDSAREAVQITTRVPDIRVPDPPVVSRAQFWPEGEALPEAFERPPHVEPQPCRACRKVYLEDGAQAVVVLTYSENRTVVYLQCRGRACGKRFSLPVKA